VPVAADDDWQELNRAGLQAAARADWGTAEATLREALAVLEAAPRQGPRPVDGVADDDARLAAVAGNLGVVLLERGAVAEARQWLERALAIRRTVLGASDPAIAEALGNLGELERRAGRLERARQLHEEALAMRRETLEPGHPDIALGLTNLGVALYDLGLFAEASARLEAALAIQRERLGTGHRATLETAVSLAAVAQALGDPAAAESALRVPVAVVGATAMARGGIAAKALREMVDLRLRRDDADPAVLLCEDAVLGVGRPAALDLATAELLGSCARALLRVGARDRAVGLLEGWLTGTALAPPIEAELRWSLAETAAAGDDLEGAEENLARAVDLLGRAGDPRLAVAFNNLAALRFERGRPLDAAADLERALALLDAGQDAPDEALLSDVLANYAIVLRTLDREDEAVAAEERLIDLATDSAAPGPTAGE